MRTITLLTDFGTADGYVAAMKGVILSECPDARIIDAAHDIPAHDVRAGAWALRHYWRLYPKDTIHIAVVDPGVGSARRAMLAQADGRWLIGPDNGLFSWALREARTRKVWALKSTVRRADAIGATFHGRDIFAYAAGLLASGIPASSLIDRAIKPHRFSWPHPTRTRTTIRGSIIHIDRFGNAITNIPAPLLLGLGREPEITSGDFRVRGLCRCFAERNPGHPLALIESTGLLELAICEGNAVKFFNLEIGTRVFVYK